MRKNVLAKYWWSGYLLTALVVVCALLWLRFAKPTATYNPTPQPVQVAKEAKAAKKVSKRTVKPGPEQLITLDPVEAAEALKMPDLATGQDNVLAIVTIPPSGESPVTAVSTLTPQGEGKIVYRQEPQPFFRLQRGLGVSARYLFVGRNIAEMEVVATPLRIGPVEVQAGAGVEVRREDSALGARGWIGAEYRF